MANPKPVSPRRRSRLWLAYAGAVAVFLGICAQFYLPGKGFTYLIMFGGKESARYLPELKRVSHYEAEDSHGYDAQYYAQIAMHPWLSSRSIKGAVDSLPYRARRILFCWTAYGLAFGDPVRALHIYAAQNIVCWLLLAGLLLRWFPATNLENFLRWLGVMFSFGLCICVRGSLVDGPSLLLIAIGVALAETGRPWWSAAVLGAAGLGKETNILAGSALAPSELKTGESWWKPWLTAAARGAIVLFPLALWLLVLRVWLGSDGDPGARNFDWPFAAYIKKWRETLGQLHDEGTGSVAQWSLLMLVTLTVQWLFFALRPRWEEMWWRIGLSYSVLMIFLGDAVWEGYPGAASRVLLPMALAFNVLVPRGRAWWAVLLLGNLTLFFVGDTLKPPGSISFELNGPRELTIANSGAQQVEARFDDKEWFLPERSRFDYWRWSRGSATMTLHNAHPFPVQADVTFELKSNDERSVKVQAGERVIWEGGTTRTLRGVTVRAVELPPGDTTWRFSTDRVADFPSNGDPRKLAFSLRNLEIKVLGKAEPPPKK